MKAMIISASERRYGMTALVSEKSQVMLHKLGIATEIIYLCEMNYSPCNGCGKDGHACNYRVTPCEKEDDIPQILQKLIAADIIIYACPVHAFGINHLMQIFLERIGVGYLRFNRPLANKIGGCIIVGRKYHLGHAHDQLINNMLLNRMIIPGSGFPVLIHSNEQNKDNIAAEETVALEQLLVRLVNVGSALDLSQLIQQHNERTLLALKEAQP